MTSFDQKQVMPASLARRARAIPCVGVLVAALAVFSTAAPAAESRPSFSCSAARSPVEKTICRDPRLGALDQRIARAFRSALQHFDSSTQLALRADQRLFLAVRDGRAAGPGSDLAGDLEGRAITLERIDFAPRPEWRGRFEGAIGLLEITPAANGLFAVKLLTVGARASLPTCDVEVSAKPDGQALIAGTTPAELKENAGWWLRLSRAGSAVEVKLMISKASDTGGPPFCGMGGLIDGMYLPVTATATPAAR